MTVWNIKKYVMVVSHRKQIMPHNKEPFSPLNAPYFTKLKIEVAIEQ